ASPVETAPASIPVPSPQRPTELVIRFREALSYERSVEIFKRISEVLADFSGQAAVVLELPRPTGKPTRVSTPFHANASEDVAKAVEREVGADVVEVVLPPR
ncbi:MAG TPA: hypothetical protein VFV20_06240, partial [Candidatus Limnocylindria bacterium]|nr:hypothetical protein [Candidatus Limnocylindria bacterium]